MATINPVITTISDDGSVIKIDWAALTTTNSDGLKVDISKWADKTATFTGTFGTGGTVILQGSNDGGTTWITLTDPQGNAISKTANSIEAVLENPESIRPLVTGGDGTTSLRVIITARLSNTLRQ